MNGACVSRTEKFNQLIRGVVVLAFTFGIVYGFVVSKVLSTETFVVMASIVFTWWFKSRDDEKKKDAVVDAPLNPSPPPPTP